MPGADKSTVAQAHFLAIQGTAGAQAFRHREAAALQVPDPALGTSAQARSPVFKALLSGGMREGKEEEVEIQVSSCAVELTFKLSASLLWHL